MNYWLDLFTGTTWDEFRLGQAEGREPVIEYWLYH